MAYRTTTLSAALLVLLASALSSQAAFAQYVWLDEKGSKHYSDRPPPPSVPANRILGMGRNSPPPVSATPANAASAAVAGNAAAAGPAANATPSKPAASLADRNAEFNKRRAEQAEKEKKAADQEKLAQQKKANCERAAGYKRSLESGVRMARINANGEQVYLTDEQREQELREARRMLEGCV